MAATEENSFADAERLWASGDVKGATELHVELSRHASTPDLRLRSVLALVERLNPGSDVEPILEACETGIQMAENLGEDHTKSYLMAMRAKNLAILNGLLVTAHRRLRLAT